MALISWNTPLNNATDSAGVLTKTSGASNWTSCLNGTSDAETYSAGTDYDFIYNAAVTASPNYLVQIGLMQSAITNVDQIKYGWNLTDAIKYIDQGSTYATGLTPNTTDTYHIEILSNTVRFFVLNAGGSQIFTHTSTTAFSGSGWSHQSTMYYPSSWCSVQQGAAPPSTTGVIYPPNIAMVRL